MIQNLRGIILRKTIYSENDLIISVLSESGHKYQLIVKGAASAHSRRRSHLDLMNLINGSIYTKTTRSYLQNVECQHSFTNVKGVLEHNLRIQIIMEIIEKTIYENDAHPEIFTVLEQTLTALNSPDPNPFLPEIAMIKIAHFLGFLPSFKSCGSCHNELTDDNAGWSSEAGTLHCRACSSERHSHFPIKYRKALEFFRHAPNTECQKVILHSEEQSIMRSFLPHIFTSQMDKPLKSLTALA